MSLHPKNILAVFLVRRDRNAKLDKESIEYGMNALWVTINKEVPYQRLRASAPERTFLQSRSGAAGSGKES